MSLDFQTPGPAFVKSPDIRVKFAVKSGLLGHWILGKSVDASRRNLVAGRPNGSFGGSPGVFDSHLVFGASSWLDTLIPEAAEMTILVVGQTPQADDLSRDVLWASTDQGPAAADVGRVSVGLSLMRTRTGAGDTTIRSARWNGAAASIAQAIIGDNEGDVPGAAWTLYCARIGQTSLDLDDLTRGVNQRAVPTIARDPNTNTIRIGSRYGNTGTIGVAWIHQASIFNRYLTTDEMLRHGAQMKLLGARGDITF